MSEYGALGSADEKAFNATPDKLRVALRKVVERE
jgi:hypothetical protein